MILIKYTYLNVSQVCSAESNCDVECSAASACQGATVNGIRAESLDLTVNGFDWNHYTFSSGIIYAPNNYLNGINAAKHSSSLTVTWSGGGDDLMGGTQSFINNTNYVSYQGSDDRSICGSTIEATDVDEFYFAGSDCWSCSMTWNFSNVCYFEFSLSRSDRCYGNTYVFNNVGMIYAGQYAWDCICSGTTVTASFNSTVVIVGGFVQSLNDIMSCSNYGSGGISNLTNYNPNGVTDSTIDENKVTTGCTYGIPTAAPTEIPTTIPTAIPTNATITPTSMPSNLPSGHPSRNPSKTTSIPTNTPTGIPTSIPTSTPTSIPTSIPTGIPTGIPTVEPSEAVTTAGSPGSMEEWSSTVRGSASADTSDILSQTSIYALIIVGVISACIVCLFVLCCFVMLNFQKLKSRENALAREKAAVQLEQIQMKKIKSASQSPSGHGSVGIDLRSVDLKSQSTITGQIGEKKHSSGNLTDDGVFDHEDDDGIDEIYINEGSRHDTMTSKDDGDNGEDREDADVDNYDYGHSKLVSQLFNVNVNAHTGGGAETEAEQDNLNSIKVSLDEKEYKKWTEKQVLLWFKENLIANGLTQEKAKSFLTEFAKKNISGGTLYAIKNGSDIDKKLNTLRSEFSNKNQGIGIWMIVQSCIETIGDSAYMDE